MEHQYFQTVSGFKAHRTTNKLHDPLDYVTEKFGLSYLDTELDHYLCDICFQVALENDQVWTYPEQFSVARGTSTILGHAVSILLLTNFTFLVS